MTDQGLQEAQTDQEAQRGTIALKTEQLELEDKEADLKLKKRLANSAIGLMFGQLVIADLVFIVYGDTNGWDIPPGVIGGWLAATTVQVFAVVLVITEYLFPREGRRAKRRR